MLTSSLRDVYLVDEMQLGERLNESLQSEDRADFALMLSMLSNDVLDAPFTNNSIPEEKETTDDALREKFQLLSSVSKYAKDIDFDRGMQMSDLLHKEGQNAVFLACCMKNEPLVPFKHDLAPEVFSQLPPLKQEKVRRAFSGVGISYEPLKERGDGFLVLDEMQSAKSIESRV